ncbi:MAG: T9SS type A sorting domain-containing protein [Candidatus Electryonea clarkiae]|nr:T9SS type A sorting domain-containing protein [Candidatus Electryonea clarkiae]MDP8288435.1 T9SS type A sorting domain-containing protein [Candidatus Electryonea clarkiae]
MVKSTLFILLGLLIALSSAYTQEGITVGYALADNDPVFLDGFLADNDQIGETTYIDCRNSIPELEDLLEFDVVMTWSNYSYFGNGGAAMGDVLADYIDEGGAVIVCVFALYNQPGNLGIGGRLLEDEYLPVDINGSYTSGAFTLGDYDETHPIMEGVESGSTRYANVSLDPLEDAYLVASYTNNYPFVVVKQACVALNMFPGNNNYAEDIPLMVGNCLVWAVSSLGSNISGTVTHSLSGDSLEGAIVNFFDVVGDSLYGSDTTDAAGFYECPKTFPDGFVASVTVSKELYLDYTVDEIEIGEPEDIEMNFQLTPFLNTDIEALQTEVPTNTWVDVAGIVTIPTNAIDVDHTSFYIQDDTQYGIHIYGEDAWDAETYGELNRGDEVRIVGRLDEYEGVNEINNLYLWELISTGNAIPEPLDMNTGTMSNMQEMEGSWAHIEGFIQNDPSENGSYTLITNDGSGDCNVRIIESTGIDLLEWERGDWLMFDGVIGIYEVDVQIIPSLSVDITRTPMDVPAFARISADTLENDPNSAEVAFSWDHTGLGVMDYLYYDGGPATGYSSWPDHTMGVHISPEGDSRLVAVKCYLKAEAPGNFNVNIYHWNPDSAMPGNFQYIEYPVEVKRAHHGWYDVIISDENINLTGDFIVGFGSVDNTIQLGISNHENDRAWDYDGDDWTAWTGSYVIRAVVQYSGGGQAVIGDNSSEDELDEWTTFNVYRDGNLVGENLRQTSFTDTVTEIGVYEYSVSAVYHEGETAVTSPLEVRWGVENEFKDQPLSGFPSEWSIASTYPNPFNPTIHVVVAVPQVGKVKAEIFDVLGRSVVTLTDGLVQPGFHRMNWHASGPTGIYFLKVSSESGWSDTRKLLYMK